MRITKPQQVSLARKWKLNDQGLSYLEFRRTIRPELGGGAIMVAWCGMWLGIETDGYCHS